MAIVNGFAGDLIVLQLGDGGTPENFTANCSINTNRSMKFLNNLSSAELADCVTPTNPAQVSRLVKSQDFTFQGAGKADGPGVWALVQWWNVNKGAQKNVKVVLNRTGANGGFTVAVPMLMESFDVTGTHGEYSDFTISLAQASVPTAVTANG